MTATAITPQTILGPFAATNGEAGVHDFTWADSSSSATDTLLCTGNDILMAYNSGSVAGTVTITSVADEKNRLDTISAYSMAAGDYAAFGVGLTNSKGWKDSAGKITVTTSAAEVKVAVLRLPAGYPS
jgi:hypothetical protein